MSGTSSVGGRGVYEAGDQRNVKDSEKNEAQRYKEGQPNSHIANDSSTQYRPTRMLYQPTDHYGLCRGREIYCKQTRPGVKGREGPR